MNQQNKRQDVNLNMFEYNKDWSDIVYSDELYMALDVAGDEIFMSSDGFIRDLRILKIPTEINEKDSISWTQLLSVDSNVMLIGYSPIGMVYLYIRNEGIDTINYIEIEGFDTSSAFDVLYNNGVFILLNWGSNIIARSTDLENFEIIDAIKYGPHIFSYKGVIDKSFILFPSIGDYYFRSADGKGWETIDIREYSNQKNINPFIRNDCTINNGVMVVRRPYDNELLYSIDGKRLTQYPINTNLRIIYSIIHTDNIMIALSNDGINIINDGNIILDSSIRIGIEDYEMVEINIVHDQIFMFLAKDDGTYENKYAIYNITDHVNGLMLKNNIFDTTILSEAPKNGYVDHGNGCVGYKCSGSIQLIDNTTISTDTPNGKPDIDLFKRPEHGMMNSIIKPSE